MRLKYWVIAVIFFLFLLFFSNSTQAQFPQASEQETPKSSASPTPIQIQNSKNNYEFKFGVLEDSEPVSTNSRDPNIYCNALKKHLDEYAPKEVTITYSERRKQYDGIIIECGPNSITSKRIKELQERDGSKGFFSEPFFRTETKILIKNSKRDLLKQEKLPLLSFTNQSSSSLRVGVIGDTTSEEVLKSIYPTAILKKFDRRKDAIESLQSNNDNSIDAYISDEVLLPSMLKVLPQSDFSIEPKLYGLTNEYYGVIIYNDPKSPYSFDKLREKVDTWINSKEGQKEREKLEKEVAYSATSGALKFFISFNPVYDLPPFILLLLTFLLPIVLMLLMIWLLSCIAKIPLLRMLLNRIRRRGQENNKIAHIVNIFVAGANNTLIPQYIDRNAVVALLREVGDPLLQASEQNISSEVEVDQVAENLANRAKRDPYFLKVLKALFGTVKDATREETDKWLRSVITRVFEKIDQNMFNHK